jgi:RNase P/RNase MRP subunit p30
MSTRKAREAQELRQKIHHAHLKHVLGLDEETKMKACQQCHRATLGRLCYWCGKRRGLW